MEEFGTTDNLRTAMRIFGDEEYPRIKQAANYYLGFDADKTDLSG